MEIQDISWKLVKTGKLNSFKYNIYEYNNKEIIVVKCGVGISLAASCTELFIFHFKPIMVLNYGAVGGSNKLKLFQVIIPKKIFFHDVITPWYPRGQIPYQSPFYFE